MKILIAPDKFKGCLSANEICKIISSKLINAGIECFSHPMADGGDGSLEVIKKHIDLKKKKCITSDPLGRKISTFYYTSSDTAFIELASASGIALLKEDEKNPLKSSTLGTGLLVKDAVDSGYRNIKLFLGGSATNDAGIGIAQALGYKFLDSDRNELLPNGNSLSHIQYIEKPKELNISELNIELLCDVTNPLYGPDGAAHTYAAQKGASASQINYLDSGLACYAEIIKTYGGTDISTVPGSGAAGGIAASLIPLLDAQIKNGFLTISEITGLEEQIEQADHIISGEGKLDEQSLNGKVIDGIASLCKKYNKNLSLFVGTNLLSNHELQISGIYELMEKASDIDDSINNAVLYLSELTDDFIRNL